MISTFIADELHGLKTVLEVHGQYMLSLSTRDWYGVKNISADVNSENDRASWFSGRAKPWPEADALKKVTADVTELQVKIQAELRYAKREVAWGKLGPKDMVTICRLLKNILVPLWGMESLTGITDRIEKRGGWRIPKMLNSTRNLIESDLNSLEDEEMEQWKDILGKLNYPVHRLQQAVIEGIDHSLYTLELAKRPVSPVKTDLEEYSLGCSTGKISPAKGLENMIQDFLGRREGLLREWCTEKGVDDSSQLNGMAPLDNQLHQRHQSQLYLILNVSLYCS